MNDHEKRLDELLSGETWPGERQIRELVRAALAQARADALEEAATSLEARASECWGGPTATAGTMRAVYSEEAQRIRALSTTPSAYIPVAKVRETLKRQRDAARVTGTDIDPVAFLEDAARSLGVPLDGAACAHCVSCRERQREANDGSCLCSCHRTRP